MLAPPSGSDRLAWNLLFDYEYSITVKECIIGISACCWLSLQEVSFTWLGSVQVCLVPSGNLICTYHIVYRSITKYLFKFPQHGALFLLSETVLVLIISSKSIYFPAKHYFTFHLISGKFLPICSNRLKFRMRMSLLFRALAFKHTHNCIHTEAKTNCPPDLRCLGRKQDPYHTLQEAASLPTQVGKNTPWTWNITRNGLRSCTKNTSVLNNPICTPHRIPFRSLKGLARPFSRGNRKGQFWYFGNTRCWGRK